MGAIRMLAMMGGGGDFIKSLAPVFYIKDLTQVVNGYFVDSSGNNKQIQAAQTTVANDSLIMPANDTDIINALTSAGCYSQYYTDNANPKTVLISNISPCYNDYAYFDYFNKKKFSLFSSAQTTKRENILSYIDTSICNFNSIQTGTAVQVTGIYQCYAGKLAYIDYGNWGNQNIQKVNATEIDHSISSTGYLANTTYRIQLFSPRSNPGFKKIKIAGQKLSDFNTECVKDFSLSEFYFADNGPNHQIGSIDFINMPLIIFVATGALLNTKTINSTHFVSKNLTLFYLSDCGTNHIIRMSHFTSMPLGGFYLNYSGNANSGDVGELRTAIANIQVINSGVINITNNLKSWSNSTIRLESGYSEASVRNFIINWSAVAGTGVKTISLRGTNAAIHVNAVDDPTLYNAVQLLISKGKTLLYNTY